ncbi:hypothetical protein [Streptomyces caniscabiei]|uniref:hypothetical protein n=1 Tax=Streptomyces caniscabiei TaxID=2746961 RepID=UPI001872648A|nr:hypothetical protein [Streptomyces caniscabiei]MBE4797404.1 hypothetical protein [Streptomyces caniscabiei]
MSNRYVDAYTRFVDNVDISGGPNACWPWKGHRTEKGYGVFQVGGKKVRAHRWFAERIIGEELEPDLFVCHTCDVTYCQNPRHWFIGDALDNNRDKAAKGRHPGGYHGNQNESKTHCLRGHAFNAENTRIDRRGFRACLACDPIQHGRTTPVRKALAA